MATNGIRVDIIDEDFFKRVVRHHLKTEDFRLIEHKTSHGSSKGDNYMGDLISAKVKVELGSGEEKSFHWMIKLLKSDANSNGQNIGRLMGVFNREAKLYKNILPALNEFGELKYCPLVFAEETEGQEALVLEHMGQFGFTDAKGKKSGLDEDHVKLVLDWLARFHAYSYVMMTRYPGGIEAWRADNPWSIPPSSNPPPIMTFFFSLLKDDQKVKFVRIGEMLDEEYPENNYAERCRKFLEGPDWVVEFRQSCQKTEGRVFCTLSHLDPWFNNMLFKYDKLDRPENVLLLDFQLTGYTSPSNDLVYFLLSSTTAEFRKQNLESILTGYFETLSQEIRKAGIENFSYTKSELLEDYHKSLKLGLMFIIMALPMMVNFDPEDTVDIASVDLSNSDASKQFEKMNSENFVHIFRKNDLLRERTKGVLDDMIEAKYI